MISKMKNEKKNTRVTRKNNNKYSRDERKSMKYAGFYRNILATYVGHV